MRVVSSKAVSVPADQPSTLSQERRGLYFYEVLPEVLHAQARARRRGWNGKGMFIFLVQGSRFAVNRPPLLGIYPEGTVIDYHAHIDMKTAQGYIIPWLASQADLIDADWELVPSSEPL